MHRIFRYHRTLLSTGILLLLLLLAVASTPEARAAQTVPRHNLDCSQDFPCPEALRRRVDFWVEVFSQTEQWDRLIEQFNERTGLLA